MTQPRKNFLVRRPSSAAQIRLRKGGTILRLRDTCNVEEAYVLGQSLIDPKTEILVKASFLYEATTFADRDKFETELTNLFERAVVVDFLLASEKFKSGWGPL